MQKAFHAYVMSKTWDEARLSLEQYITILGYVQVPAMFQELIDNARKENDVETAAHFERLSQLLKNATAYGVEMAWQQFQSQPHPEVPSHIAHIEYFARHPRLQAVSEAEVLMQMLVDTVNEEERAEADEALDGFLKTEDKEEFLEEWEGVLLGDTALTLLRIHMLTARASEHDDLARYLEGWLRILNDARIHGVSNTIRRENEEWQQAVERASQALDAMHNARLELN